MTKDHIFREVRKLIDTLNRFGNCIVPSIPGNTDPSAKQRLAWIIGKAKEEHGLSLEAIQEGVDAL